MHSAYKNLLGIRPAEGGLASWLGKADVMKPHSAYGFPAGRAQLWKLLGEGTDKFFRKASPQALSKKIGVDIFDSFEALEKSYGTEFAKRARGSPAASLGTRALRKRELSYHRFMRGVDDLLGNPIDRPQAIKDRTAYKSFSPKGRHKDQSISWVIPKATKKSLRGGGYSARFFNRRLLRQVSVHEGLEGIHAERLIGSDGLQKSGRNYLSHHSPGVIADHVRFVTKFGSRGEQKGLKSYLKGQVRDAEWNEFVGGLSEGPRGDLSLYGKGRILRLKRAKKEVARAKKFQSLVEGGYRFSGVRPSSGGHGAAFPKADVMKPHGLDFPGGRKQDFKSGSERSVLYVDVETQGLRRSMSARGQTKRTFQDVVRISQFSVFDPRGEYSQTGQFTNILDHLGKDVDPNNLSEAVLNDLQRKRPKTDSLYRAGFWDKGITRPGNVLRGVLQRHIKATQESPGKAKDISVYGEEFLGNIISRSKKGPTTVKGWNLSYDWKILADEATDRGGKFKSLFDQVMDLSKGPDAKVKWVDVHGRWKQQVFESMMRDRNFTPVHTDYKAVQQFVDKGIAAPDDIGKLLRPHHSLRKFMDDLDEASKGGTKHARKVWTKRFSGKKPLDSNKKIEQIVDILTKSSEKPSYQSFHEAQRQMRLIDGGDEKWLQNVFHETYSEFIGDQKHVSLVGKGIREQTGAAIGIFDDAFNFILGGRQSQVGDMAMAAAQERWEDKLPTQFRALEQVLKGQVHDSDVDTKLTSALDGIFDFMDKQEGAYDNQFHALFQGQMERTKHYQAGMHELLESKLADKGVVRHAAAAERTIVGKIKEHGSKLFGRLEQVTGMQPKVMGAWGVLGLSAAYLLNERNDDADAVNAFHAIRDPHGAWEQIAGITPSGDTKTDFGSGRNPMNQLLGTPYGAQVEWIGASQLGLRGDFLYASILEQNQPNEVMRKGTWIGEMVADTLKDSISGSEQYVAIPELGIHGQIDIHLASGIPMEIKTVETAEKLKSLAGPKAAAVSQANFYALATGKPHAYVAYFSRENPGDYKLFKVHADRQRLLADRQEVLQAQRMAVDSGQKRWEPFQSSRFISLNNPGIGLERLWDTFSSTFKPLALSSPANVPLGNYPRAMNSFDAISRLEDYGKHKRAAFYSNGAGGVVQQLHRGAKGAKIRDQRTRLSRVSPNMSTSRAPCPVNRASRCEAR